jgi:hypothetical protein
VRDLQPYSWPVLSCFRRFRQRGKELANGCGFCLALRRAPQYDGKAQGDSGADNAEAQHHVAENSPAPPHRQPFTTTAQRHLCARRMFTSGTLCYFPRVADFARLFFFGLRRIRDLEWLKPSSAIAHAGEKNNSAHSGMRFTTPFHQPRL